ncbi:SDR family oxidoreductase [Curtobacterium sp. MCPF17_052]|uniref:SDR family oxidoreductase n=1 Tax=Curtobacterium sp. MCPF17_052 TaxID=2175655 RepID=UPI0024DFEED5|nr:SDR family oxidoreductase [Curtobacterium sp. MCPF17_052]WIB14019.1 SDR family oxidoreductase [Curtobacterium sp. MCPF17_052]
MIHLTKCLAVEWGQYGIRVNAVAPTFIETDGTAPALSDAAFRTDTVERIAALHRIGQPEEVAAAVTFLAGEGGIARHRDRAADRRRVDGSLTGTGARTALRTRCATNRATDATRIHTTSVTSAPAAPAPSK